MKKLTPKQIEELLIRKQRSECTLCDKRGFTFIKVDNETKARPCKCTMLKKPETVPALPFKDDMGDIISEAVNNF